MAIKPKVGVLVMALLEDDYNKTAHVRPMAQKVADKIGGILGRYADTVCPPLVEEEHQAEAAAQENSRRADGLLKALKQAFPEDQVKTLGYRLSPVYAPKDKSSPPEIKGYQAVHRFQVKVKGPARLGGIIDLALKNGANGVSGPVWEHSRLEELQREAAVVALERVDPAKAHLYGVVAGKPVLSTAYRVSPMPPTPPSVEVSVI